MADIELGDIGEDRTEQEEAEQAEEADTSFTEQNESIQIFDGSNPRFSHFTDLNDFDFRDVERNLAKSQQDKELRKDAAIQTLKLITGENFKDHGVNSRELFDGISDVKFSNKGKKIITLKFKGEDVKLTVKGKLDKRSGNTDNKDILKAEYNASINVLIDKNAGLSMSDVAVESVQESVIGSLEDLVWDKYGEISQGDPDKNIEREINGILHVDDNVDYDDLEDPNQKAQYNAKIAGLKANIEHWEDLEQREQDLVKKH